MENNFSVVEDHGGGYFWAIMGDADDRTNALFQQRHLQGGGYTWEGIITSLVEMKMPDILPDLEFCAEADNLVIHAEERKVLEDVARLVQSAIDDHSLMIAAIENAGDELE
jgi:hypothetical protein